jgi:Transposase DDE domain
LVKAQPHPPRKGQASPDADWTRRAKNGHFGDKVHLTVDQGRGLIRRMAQTSARTSESHLFEGMVIAAEAAVFADGAYAKDAGKNMSSFTRKRIWEKPLDAKQKWP